MCGRFALKNPESLRAAFGLEDVPDLPPRYNIAPSQDVAAVRVGDRGRELAMLHWLQRQQGNQESSRLVDVAVLYGTWNHCNECCAHHQTSAAEIATRHVRYD